MNDNLKTVLVFIISICLLIVSFSVAYSLCIRGSAEFRFSSAGQQPTATNSIQIGVSVGGYRIDVLKE